MKKEMLKPIVLIIVLLVLISLAACTLPSSRGTVPPTPTMPLEIPVITAAPTEIVEEAEVVDDEVVPIEVEEEIEEPVELPEVEEEVEEPEVEPTPIPEGEDEEGVDPVAEIVSATPTAIPFVYTANPDPMVMFYGATNCYVEPNTDSTVSGVAPRSTALGAFRRNWNFYQVVHPTRPGHVCWVTGDTMRPNQSAFSLKP